MNKSVVDDVPTRADGAAPANTSVFDTVATSIQVLLEEEGAKHKCGWVRLDRIVELIKEELSDAPLETIEMALKTLIDNGAVESHLYGRKVRHIRLVKDSYPVQLGSVALRVALAIRPHLSKDEFRIISWKQIEATSGVPAKTLQANSVHLVTKGFIVRDKMGDDNYCYRNTTQKGAMYGAGHNVEEVEIIDLDRPPKQYAVPLITSLPEPKRVATAATQPASPAPSKPRPVATVAVVAAPQPAPSPAADPKPAATVIPEANLGLKDLAALADAICAGGEFPEWWPLFTPYISAIARQCEKTNRLVAERVRLHNEIKALEDALKPIQGIPSLHNAAEALRTKLASLNERLAKLKRKLDEPSSRVEREKTRRIQAEVKEFAARIKEILMLGEPKN